MSNGVKRSSRLMSRRELLKLGVAGTIAASMGPLSGCGTGSASVEDYPEGPITIIIAYEAGGGADLGARILQPFVERDLGGPLEILNRPGGGGWSGWSEIANAEPDGYTIGGISSPNFMTGYLDPRFNRDETLESFTPIANQVTDYGAIAIRRDEQRFGNIEELIEYSKDNQLTATSTGVGSDDHFASLTVSDVYGSEFQVIHNEGSAQSQTALLGGTVDVLFANVGELKPLHDDGELEIIAVMSESENRSEFLPDVPTLAEAGYPDVYSWSSRGYVGPEGLDQRIVTRLAEAFRKGIQNKSHLDELAAQGLEVDYRNPEEYQRMLVQDQRRARPLGRKFIWRGEEEA